MKKIYDKLRSIKGVINTAIVSKNGDLILESDDGDMSNNRCLRSLEAFVNGMENAVKLFKMNLGDERTIHTSRGELKILNGGEYIIFVLCDNGTNVDEIKQYISNLKP